MEIARYTCNASGVIPVFNEGYVYETNEVDNGDGTYTVTITSDDDFSSCNFSGKTNLLTVEHLKVTSKVTNMSYMFRDCTNLTSLDLSNFNTSNVTNMSYMFRSCTNLTSLDVSSFNASKVTNMSYMFRDCTNLTSLDVSSFNASKVTDMTYMFRDCTNLTSLDLSNFNTSEATNMSYAFDGCTNLVSVTAKNCNRRTVATIAQNLPIRTVQSQGVINIGAITDDGSTLRLPCLGWKMKSDVVLSKEIFKYTVRANGLGCKFNSGLVYAVDDVINDDSTVTRTITSDVSPSIISFEGNTVMSSLKIESVDTSEVTSMNKMFYNCTKLTTIDGLNKLDTSNVTDMSYMFNYCESLTELDISNFNTSKVTDMSYIFGNCKKLTELDLSNFNTSKVTNMSRMFGDCKKLTSLDLSNFDTNEVTDMNRMFFNCDNLTSLDVSNFDTKNVTTMSRMFYYCTNLTSLNLSNFNTNEVTTMEAMFYYCENLTSLDLSNFNTDEVTTMSNMFNGCSKLSFVNIFNCNLTTVTKITVNLPKKSSSNYGIIVISENIQTDSTIKENCKNKYWTIYTLLMIYTFNNYADVSPTFNEEYTYDYINLDENNNDNTITRKIFVNELPTSVNFKNCKGLISFNGLYATSIINMSEMFYDCNKLTSVDLSNIDVSKVTDMENIFYNCKSLTTLDIRNWIHNNVSQIGVNTLPVGDEEERKVICSDTFIAPEGWIVININERNEVIRFVTNKSGVLPTFTISEDGYTDYITEERYDTGMYIVSIFTNNLRNLPTDISFENLNSLLSVEKINISNEATNINRMFYGCTSLTSVNLSSFNTENIVEMISTFENCNSLISLDLSSFNTNKVVDMKNIFKNCSSLTLLDLSNFNIGNETDIDGAFDNCTSLTNVGTLYCTENTIDKIKSVFAPAETCVFWVTDTKASDFTDTDKIIHKNYKHTVKNIYLPSSLKQNDRLYWDEETKEYLIEYSNGDIRGTNIREQIDIKTYKPMYTIECSSNILANNIKVTVPFKIKSGDYDASKELEYLKQSFELRHPDADDVAEDWGFMGVGEEGTGLNALIDWVDGCSDEEFVSDFEQHFLKSYTLRYYCLVVLIGAVDNLGKNMMLDTSDNKIYFPRFYDIDTILSYDNSGDIKFDVDIEMEQGYWNTSSSRLWTRIRDLMHDDIVETYNDMRKNGVSYENIMKYMYEEQISKIPQTYYNKDYDVKYAPFGDSYMGMAHGDGYQHMKRWLKNRFIFCDTLFDYAPSYNNDVLTIRANTTELMNIQIETYTPVYQHVSWYNGQMDKKKINGKSAIEFSGKAMAETDQEVLIYGGSNIKKITGISSMNPNQMLIGGATRLVELDASNSPLLADINSNKANLSPHTYLNKVNLSNCPLLGGNLRLNNSQLIQEVNIKGTAITGLNLPSSIRNLEILRLPSTITSLTLNDAGLLNTLEFDEGVNLQTINMVNCNNLTNIINFDLTKAQSISLDNSMVNYAELYFSNTNNLTLKNMSNLERVIYTPNTEHEVFDKANVDNSPNYVVSTFNCPKLNTFMTTAPYRDSYNNNVPVDYIEKPFIDNEVNMEINTLNCEFIPGYVNADNGTINPVVGNGTSCTNDYIPIVPNGTYIIDNGDTLSKVQIGFFNKNKVWIEGVRDNVDTSFLPYTFKAKEDYAYMTFHITRSETYTDQDIKLYTDVYYEEVPIKDYGQVTPNTVFSANSLDLSNTQFTDVKLLCTTDTNVLKLPQTVKNLIVDSAYDLDTNYLTDGDYDTIHTELYEPYNTDYEENVFKRVPINYPDFFGTEAPVTAGKYIHDDGSLANYANWYATVEFYDISHCTSIRLNGRQSTNRIFFYDSNQKFIRYYDMILDEDIDIPNNAKYARWRASTIGTKRNITVSSKATPNLIPSASDGSIIQSMYAPSNTVQPASGVWDLKGLELEEYHTFGLNNDVKLVDNTLTMPNRYDEYSVSVENKKSVNEVARYTASSANTFPTFNSEFTYTYSIIQLDDGVYEYSIIADNMDNLPTTISFNGKSNLLTVEYLKVTSDVTNMGSMFYNCVNLTSVNTSGWDTSNVTDMSSMFQSCSILESIEGIGEWNTSNVTNMSNMFYDCEKLTNLDLSDWDTSNVTDMSNMFISCDNLTSLNLSGWDAPEVTNTSYMFYSCNRLTSLDVSGWKTSKVTSMLYMFYDCKNLTTLDLSNFDTSKVTNMGFMFSGCNKLTDLDSMTNILTSLNLSNTILDISSLLDVIDNLATVTTTQSLTLGATLLAKLTEEQIAVAVNKGWTVN